MPAGKHLYGMNKGNHIFGTAKVGEKGQIVIPKEARDHFSIKPGDTLLILGNEESGILISKPDVLSDVADQILGNLKKGEKEP